MISTSAHKLFFLYKVVGGGIYQQPSQNYSRKQKAHKKI